MTVIRPRHMSGRCRTGSDRTGAVIHAVADSEWTALCGKQPGRTSAGWSVWIDDEVSCPRCLKKLATIEYQICKCGNLLVGEDCPNCNKPVKVSRPDAEFILDPEKLDGPVGNLLKKIIS